MKKGGLFWSVLVGGALLMTACSTVEPKVESKVEKKKELSFKLHERKVFFENERKVFSENQIKFETLKLTTLVEKSTLTKSHDMVRTWTPLQLEDEIEWNAKELLGRKYVWGATGPVNYDCSGFTQKIYRDLGIEIPRVSRNQAKHGEFVSFDELEKGDMVFFDTNRRKPGLVTHVGIYLGAGNFIHASSSAKKIVICNFKKDRFYKKKFLWGRRVTHMKNYVASVNDVSIKSAI